MSLFHKTIYTCEEATKLVIIKNEQRLSAVQRIKLWFHLAVCKACKRFEIQNAWLDTQLHKMVHQELIEKMPKDSKERISEKLEQSKTGNGW